MIRFDRRTKITLYAFPFVPAASSTSVVGERVGGSRARVNHMLRPRLMMIA